MINVTDLLDVDQLNKDVDEGYITARPHPTLPYKIYNYSPKTQFERAWRDTTLICRGLIVDELVGDVVARPYRKFFNLGDHWEQFDWDVPAEVTDKMDGSLGILYCDKPLAANALNSECHAIATRGSFESGQAKLGTKILKERYSNLYVDPNYTFLFEIVGPSNRIVLFYPEDDLVVLGAVHNDYGYYVGARAASMMLNWPGPVTETFEYKTLREAFQAQPRKNAEGFVIRAGNKLVKIKQVDYLELHKIVTNLTEKTLWEALRNGQKVNDIVAPLPDEFAKWAIEVIDKLEAEFNAIRETVLSRHTVIINSLNKSRGSYTRKEFAEAVKDVQYKSMLFAIEDNKNFDDHIWKLIKPKDVEYE